MDVFESLADPTRRALLERLIGGPCRVVDLAAGFAVSRPAVSRHLSVLRAAGLVRSRVRGRESWYELEPAGIEQAEQWLASLLAPPPVGAADLDALDLEVRRTGRERTERHDETAEPRTSTRRRTA